MSDYFLIRQCRAAIEKLFQANLRLKFDTKNIFLTIKFQVAQFKLGQIYPSKKYGKACGDRFEQLITCDGVSKILNLDNFSLIPELEKIVVNLANKQSLQLLFTTLKNLNADRGIFKQLNGLRLSNNHIRTLDSIATLAPLTIQQIDLRNNDVSSECERKRQLRHSFFYSYLDSF